MYIFIIFFYQFYFLHTSRNLVSPVCRVAFFFSFVCKIIVIYIFYSIAAHCPATIFAYWGQEGSVQYISPAAPTM